MPSFKQTADHSLIQAFLFMFARQNDAADGVYH